MSAVVELGDVRHGHPRAMGVLAGQLLDPPQWLPLDGAELREVDRRHLRQREATRRLRPRERRLDERLHVGLHDAPVTAAALDLAEIDPELAREAADGG